MSRNTTKKVTRKNTSSPERERHETLMCSEKSSIKLIKKDDSALNFGKFNSLNMTANASGSVAASRIAESRIVPNLPGMDSRNLSHQPSKKKQTQADLIRHFPAVVENYKIKNMLKHSQHLTDQDLEDFVS